MIDLRKGDCLEVMKDKLDKEKWEIFIKIIKIICETAIWITLILAIFPW